MEDPWESCGSPNEHPWQSNGSHMERPMVVPRKANSLSNEVRPDVTPHGVPNRSPVGGHVGSRMGHIAAFSVEALWTSNGWPLFQKR